MEFLIQKALLFGSWSRGSAGEESDVDVALISTVFTGDRFLDRRKIVPMPFTPQTFDMGGNLVDEIIRHGEEIV